MVLGGDASVEREPQTTGVRTVGGDRVQGGIVSPPSQEPLARGRVWCPSGYSTVRCHVRRLLPVVEPPHRADARRDVTVSEDGRRLTRRSEDRNTPGSRDRRTRAAPDTGVEHLVGRDPDRHDQRRRNSLGRPGPAPRFHRGSPRLRSRSQSNNNRQVSGPKCRHSPVRQGRVRRGRGCRAWPSALKSVASCCFRRSSHVVRGSLYALVLGSG